MQYRMYTYALNVVLLFFRRNNIIIDIVNMLPAKRYW
ncbi:MAG: hypothetical protein RL172_2943 [Bacteroidota bacterium]|jgi:hypothetical protein